MSKDRSHYHLFLLALLPWFPIWIPASIHLSYVDNTYIRAKQDSVSSLLSGITKSFQPNPMLGMFSQVRI